MFLPLQQLLSCFRYAYYNSFLGLRSRQSSEGDDLQVRIKYKYQTILGTISVLYRVCNFDDEANGFKTEEGITKKYFLIKKDAFLFESIFSMQIQK